MRILIVDDTKEDLYLLETLLKGSGYEVVSAGNGVEALKKLRTESIDVIVSDILMPIMDGFQLCKEVKEKDELRDIPFIIYTASYLEEKDEKLALTLGVNKYIRKPAEPDVLIRIIQGIIRDLKKGKVKSKKLTFEDEEEVTKLYRERLAHMLDKKILSLQKEVIERKKAEARVAHLNNVLKAVRNINQLIVKEKDRDRLIRDACRNFIKTRGFNSAWIALTDKSGKVATAVEAGLGKNSQTMLKNLKHGKLPYCMQRSLAKPGILTIKDPASTCGDCLLANTFKEDGRFSSRLEHDGKIYGILTVSLPIDYFQGKEERSLFEEITGDIAYALHHIEEEEKSKKAEEELKKSEERYKELVEKAGIAILIDDEEGNIKYVNKKAAELYGYSLREMKGQSIQTLVHPDDIQMVTKFHKARVQGKQPPLSYVFRGVRKDGSVRYLELDSIPDKKEESIIGTRLYIKDITERKKTEEQIKASLREKEVLLQEIHHRVKNNMQLISSLIKLQSKHIKDEKALELFKSTQSRVQSMAVIHERLYRSKDFARVDFTEYAQNLANHLFSSYGIDPKTIKLHVNIKDILLDINTAIPCGLIINELISNSLKHAFPGDRKGEIEIVIHSLNKNEIELIVSDNGVGLPKEVDFRNTESLGLHLVTILAEDQLHGEIKLDRTKGTSFQIRLKVKQ